MRTAGAIHEPSRIATVELSARLEWHDEVDLAIGMAVMGPRDGFHVDDVHTEAASGGVRFDDPAEADISSLTSAHPAFCYTRLAALEQGAGFSSTGWKGSIEIVFERGIQGALRNVTGNLRDQGVEPIACCLGNVLHEYVPGLRSIEHGALSQASKGIGRRLYGGKLMKQAQRPQTSELLPATGTARSAM